MSLIERLQAAANTVVSAGQNVLKKATGNKEENKPQPTSEQSILTSKQPILTQQPTNAPALSSGGRRRRRKTNKKKRTSKRKAGKRAKSRAKGRGKRGTRKRY